LLFVEEPTYLRRKGVVGSKVLELFYRGVNVQEISEARTFRHFEMEKGGLVMKAFCSSRGLVGLVVLLAVALAATPLAFARGEGSFVIKAENGNTYRFGGQMRMIPTCENDWDFGLGTVTVFAPLGGVDVNFKGHTNEAGDVANNYIRTEARLYFNAEDSEGKWDFYSALEYDSAVDQEEVDKRGRDYGLERLHGSIAIPGLEQVRFHAGWDIYFLDAVEAGAGFMYADDDPGFWLTGEFDSVEFQAGYHKRLEDNFLSRDESDFNTGFNSDEVSTKADNDRDIYSAMLTYHVNDDNEVRFMGVYDVMKTRTDTRDLFGDPAAPPGFGTNNKGADVKTYRLGLLYTGKLGIVEQGGEADDAVNEFGTELGDFDIKAYALYGDVALNLTDVFGFKVMPHVGFMYTSGDDDPDDDNLEGYCGVANAQRFTPRFGGEDTIIGDTNALLGTALYGYLPELYGNLGGTQETGGVATGGFTNGEKGGRGDNPGMTMIGGGITIEPVEYISYRTNFMWIEWNEAFYVNSTAPPAALGFDPSVKVDSGTAGQQWSNSLRISLNKHVHIFGNATLFWPGEAIEDVTEKVYGEKSDDVAQRYAIALIWRF
jgi:hypothetical protein